MKDEASSIVGFTGSADGVFADACRMFAGGGPRTPYLRLTEDETSPDKGKPMDEYPIMFHLPDPRNRLVYSKDIDIYNLVGLWIYLLSGSESVHPISFYNKVARRFVDEGTNPVRLRGTWGARLFRTGAVARCISLLRVSPNTRRAYIPVLNGEDLGYQSRNLPCLAGMQFAMQAGKLNCYVTMRSQALVGVFPYDVFLLTMLHEWVAMNAGLPLGEYHHFAPLCGVRENEKPIIDEVVRWETPRTTGVSYARYAMPPMEELVGGQLALFHYCERKIRNAKHLWPTEVEQLPKYWQGFLRVTWAKAQDNPFQVQLANQTFPEGFLLKSANTLRKRALP